jgi:putative tryptophan/tyrosine transport system substrate-binding protein
MKLSLSGVLLVTLSVMLAAVGAEAEMVKIGEAQIVSHPALNKDAEGFKAALTEEGFIEGKNVEYDLQNAQGEQPNCAIIARKFEDDKVDLIHAISTPVAQANVKISKKIPIVYSSVTDPVTTGIVPKEGETGTNVTGVSDRWPVDLQQKMYMEMVPAAKRWGTIYNPGDANVAVHIKIIKETILKMGRQFVEAHVANSSEIMQAAQSLVGRVDAIHITSDNTVVSGFEALAKVCNQNKIPLFAGDRDSVPRGAIAAYALDYFQVGYTAGKQAARILKGEDPGKVPAGRAEGYSLWVNLKHAEAQGLTLPTALIEKAADRLWDAKGNLVKGEEE